MGTGDNVFGQWGSLVNSLGDQLDAVNQFVQERSGGSVSKSLSIGDMFQVQVMMNTFSQLSEMTSGVFQAINSANMSSAKGIR